MPFPKASLSPINGGLDGLTGPGGVPQGNLGGAGTWSIAAGNADDLTLNVAACSLALTGWQPGSGQTVYMLCRPTTTGTLTITSTSYLGAGSTVINGSVGFTSGSPFLATLASTDGGVTVVVSGPVPIAAPTLTPQIPWNPSAFGVSTFNQVLSATGCDEGTLFVVTQQTRITKVGLGIAAQSGNIDAGIYDTTGASGTPGNRLGSAGSTACPAVGPAALTLTASVLLNPGVYWALVAADNATVSFNALTGVQAVRALMPSQSYRVRNTTGGMFPLAATAVNNALYNSDSNVVQIVPAAA